MRALGGEANGRLARQAVLGEEVKALELLDGRSLMRLFLQNAGDKCLEMRGSMHSLREGEGTLLDLFIRILDIFGLKGRSAVDQSVNNDPNTPNIHLITMPLRFQYLRCDVVGRAADGLLLLTVEINPSS